MKCVLHVYTIIINNNYCYLSLWCIVLSSRLAVLDRIEKWKRVPAFLAKTFVLDENLQ